MKFSEFLKKYRSDNNLSKKEMADKLGITPMYYGRFENDQVYPTKKIITRFSDKLSISKKELEKYVIK